MKRGPEALVDAPHREQFPGEIAGASLKRVGPRGRDVAREAEFPGEIAGASLKPQAGAEFCREPGLIPRRNRRGLIEAVASPAATAARSDNSPAKSPGPH